jgi:hypothetical protein
VPLEGIRSGAPLLINIVSSPSVKNQIPTLDTLLLTTKTLFDISVNAASILVPPFFLISLLKYPKLPLQQKLVR